MLDAVDRLAGDPCSAESFPYGSLQVGRYEINADVVSIWHVARGETSG